MQAARLPHGAGGGSTSISHTGWNLVAGRTQLNGAMMMFDMDAAIRGAQIASSERLVLNDFRHDPESGARSRGGQQCEFGKVV